MSERTPKSFEAEVRDIVVKSSLTGVAATVLAVTIFSPAGLGGMVGTSLASGFGIDPQTGAADENIYATLPAYPAPLTPTELSDIRGQLARTTASLEITRAATEAKIEHIRSISLAAGAASFAPMPRVVPTEGLRLRAESEEAPVDEAVIAPISASAVAPVPPAIDRDLELAELMFAHENL